MVKNIIILILVLMVVVSCNRNNLNDLDVERKGDFKECCDVSDPLIELDWLADIKNQIDNNTEDIQYSIFKALYNGNTIFYTEVTDPRFEVTISHLNIYNCQGEIEKVYDWENWTDFNVDVTNIVKLYTNPIGS